ncbi:hypothetical protein [Streptomyces sp. CB02959]|uniref:hypothetical protein n=1 Tax=Streptomyces sp. CB02959 TaxID=2020330 RepID=UPI0015E0DAE0|nr:hypothetical protein [Streptomyces sp. CB02959]
MIPAAARAAVRAAVEETLGAADTRARDMAEQVVEELTAAGWTITLDDAENDRPAAA